MVTLIWLLLAAEPASSFECVQNAPSTLTVEIERRGCFGSAKRAVTLELADTGASLRSTQWREELARTRELTMEEGRRLVRRLTDAAEKPEKPSACWSTSHVKVKLQWQCSDRASQKRSYESSGCGNEQGYDRAWGLVDVAEAIDPPPDAGT